MKYLLLIVIFIATNSQRSLQHCINHILHITGNENLHCQHDDQLHFYSTYVLPDGAYTCLDNMRLKSGFYVSTIKTFKLIELSDDQVSEGLVIRPEIVFKGWKCAQDKLVSEKLFKGLVLHLAECQHEQDNFADVCIIKGWPLQEMKDDEAL